MSRWLSPIMAFCLSFIIIAGLAPSLGLQFERQLDFWLLWLLTMLLVSLPIIYLEIGLVKRAKTSALNALSTLTREADSSQRWRIVGWLAVVFIPFLAGGVLLNSTDLVLQQSKLSLPNTVVFAVSAVIAFALSYLNRQFLIIATIATTLVTIVLSQVFSPQTSAWVLTSVEFKEWGNAVILTLVATGLGLGIYGQTHAITNAQEKASNKTLPIWIAQLVAVVVFGYFAVQALIPAYAILVTTIFVAALLIQLAKEQLTHRSIGVAIQLIILLAPLLIWLFPNAQLFLTPLLMLWGLVICLIYSIFVGWVMKISHLRKALNFNSELSYNLWRVAVRIITPLAIVLAMISYIGQLI